VDDGKPAANSLLANAPADPSRIAAIVSCFPGSILSVWPLNGQRGETMMDTEAFREFKQDLSLLRDNYEVKALPHMQRAVELERNNPYYMSYLGVVLARSEKKWAEAEKLCDSAVRLKRNQAQLYLNLAEVYATAGRRDDAVEALEAGMKYARRDVRLNIAMNRLATRKPPVLNFLARKHPLNRQLGILRHRALRAFGQTS